MATVFENEVVSLPVPPVRDEMGFEAVTFGRYQPSGTMYVELRHAATSSKNPEIGQEGVRLRLYASAEQFLLDFCADHQAAVKAWTHSQKNEVYVAPEPEKEE